jgi:hypothetical protein
MKVEYHHELPNFDHRLAPVVLAGTIIGDRSATRSAGMRPGRAGQQTPIREFSIGTIRENSSGTDRMRVKLRAEGLQTLVAELRTRAAA